MPKAIQQQVDKGAIQSHVANVCPEGTKFHVLCVGWLEADEGFVIRGGNTSMKSTESKSFPNKRRELPMYVHALGIQRTFSRTFGRYGPS